MGLLLALLLLAAPALALDTLQVSSPDPLLGAQNWTDLYRDSPLDGPMYSRLFEDRDGPIWVGTTDGAARYDGHRWTFYREADGLPLKTVSAITRGPDGTLFFGSHHYQGHVFGFDGSAWTAYAHPLGPAAGERIRSTPLPARDGTLWVAYEATTDTADTRGGIARFDGPRGVLVEPPEGPSRPSVHTAFEARDNTLWFLTKHSGALRFDGAQWTRFTTDDGLPSDHTADLLEAADGTLWLATRAGIARFDGRRWIRPDREEGLPEGPISSLWQSAEGELWAAGEGSALWRRQKGWWKRYRPDQLPVPVHGWLDGAITRDGSLWLVGGRQKVLLRYRENSAWTTYSLPRGLSGGCEAADGTVWFHTLRQAVSYRDGAWIGHGPEDGFLDGDVRGLYQTRDGSLWFVGMHRGRHALAHYHSGAWSIHTAGDGPIDQVHQSHPLLPGTLGANFRAPVLQARDGSYWFAGQHAGAAALCRYDGRTWRRYTREDGLMGDWASILYETADGALWAGAYQPLIDQGSGLFRFDGHTWRRYTEEDGLSSSYITGLAEWPPGTLWAGTLNGISRFDREADRWWSKVDFPTFAPKVRSFLPTREALWFGFMPGRTAGVGRYDGQDWQIFSEADGLADNATNHIAQTADGALWFAGSRGLGRYDGERWTRYTGADGLHLGWFFPEIRPARDGTLWIDVPATSVEDMKVVHFRPTAEPPDLETFVEAAPGRVSSQGHAHLSWSGSIRWNAGAARDLRYQWRLDDGPWSAPSHLTAHTLTGLDSGTHRFEVRAVDRGGWTDPTPALHEFFVERPWWRDPYFAGPTLALLALLFLQSGRVLHRDRQLRAEQQLRIQTQERLVRELEKELLTAHDMQMGLMPKEPLRLDRVELAGRCLPANHVGGDFFQYFRRDDQLFACLADVTGHDMEAAIPMVMFHGILENQMEAPGALEDLFARLNRSLHRTLSRRTFVCFAMAHFDPATGALRLANSGCPYPYHFRAASGQVEELRVDAYPLGARPGSTYPALETRLHPGDCLVFVSDGLVEAEGEEGELFGFERMAETVRRACAEARSAAETLEHLLAALRAFKGSAPQADDMTCVVLKMSAP